MEQSHPLVPEQVTGSQTGATSKKKANSREMAIALFNATRGRLLDINHWRRFSGGKGAHFQLTDEHGSELTGAAPKVGDLIRIKLPAPSNEKGDGFDWVRIEAFQDLADHGGDTASFGFRVRPVSNPADRSPDSAHFYTSEATSTFIVERRGLIVYAHEFGRNEKPNPNGGLLNKLRNGLVAIAAMLGLAVPQWKLLTNSLLNPKR